MTKTEMTSAILDAKARAGLTWEAIAKAVGLSPVFVTSACLGMNSLSPEAAEKLCSTLELSVETVGAALREFPPKSWDTPIPTDPLVYRFYEMIHVYGDTIKALISYAGNPEEVFRPDAFCGSISRGLSRGLQARL